ncbi:endonuclease [Haliangium ochraceum]|nr:endonuclease [Haliangium ochraceum]
MEESCRCPHSLHELIDDHRRFPYTSSATDVWDVMTAADEALDTPGMVRDIYRNALFPQIASGNDFYDREHTWPKSVGFPRDVVANYPYTDVHHLFPADSRYNSTKSNKYFDDCGATCQELVTEDDGVAGGGSGVYPGNSNWTAGAGVDGRWEAWRGRRGDVARAMFYMDLRYEGGVHGVTGVAEPDLRLTDDLGRIESSTTNQPIAYMGRLSTLLRWHREDPVDEAERVRNDIVASFQGNRNPFIDHPAWVRCMFEQRCAPEPWINELHYDNDGADEGEGVEIAGPAGVKLDGYRLALYNGNSGAVYDTLELSGALDEQQGGAGTRWFAIAGLENGDRDAIALLAPDGNVVQFLGYEGALSVEGGAAAGKTSVDIGVSESGSTARGHALQLTGSGCDAESFRWAAASAHSRGRVNGGQTLSCP